MLGDSNQDNIIKIVFNFTFLLGICGLISVVLLLGAVNTVSAQGPQHQPANNTVVEKSFDTSSSLSNVTSSIKGNTTKITTSGFLDGIRGADDRSIANNSKHPEVVAVRIKWEDDWPYNGTCSGAMISEYHVLTAGHCVYDTEGKGWAKNHYIAPAANQSNLTYPFGGANVVHARTFTGWSNNDLNRWDLAVLTLDRRIGAYTGTLDIYHTDDPTAEVYSKDVTGFGYPGEYTKNNNYISPSMVKSPGTGEGTSFWKYPNVDSIHTYNLDVSEGQSGGPVIYNDKIVSILATVEATQNYGPRITDERYNKFQQWISEDNIHRSPRDAPAPAFQHPYYTNNNNMEAYHGVSTTDVSTGEDVTVTTTINNRGTAAGRNNLNVDYYISQNKSFDSQKATHLTQSSFNMPDTFEAKTLKTDITIPPTISSGDYYIHAKIINLPNYKNSVVTSKHNIPLNLDMRNHTTLNGEHLIGDPNDDTSLSVTQSTVPPGAVYNDPNGIPATYDNNKNGKISQGELVDGLQAYSNNRISQSDLVDLLQAYSNST